LNVNQKKTKNLDSSENEEIVSNSNQKKNKSKKKHRIKVGRKRTDEILKTNIQKIIS